MNQPLRDHLLKLAATGYRNSEMGQWTRRQVTAMTDRLRLKGLVHVASLSWRTCFYFDTAEKAAAFVAGKQKVSKAYKKPNMRQIVIAKPKTRAGWGKDDPAVIPKNVKRTICPPMPQPTYSNTFSRY